MMYIVTCLDFKIRDRIQNLNIMRKIKKIPKGYFVMMCVALNARL